MDVQIIDYDRESFYNLGEIGTTTVTCKVTDGAGNSSTKVIKISITNAKSKNKHLDPTAGPLEKSYNTYIRMIDKENYYKTKMVDGKTMPDTKNGALQEDSIWYNNEEYVKTITRAFENMEKGTSVVCYEYDIHDIAASKHFCRENGSGNTKTKDGLKKWYQKFIVENGAKVSGTLPVVVEETKPLIYQL